MITRPTVFILGAGASYNFGYPLGKNLVDIILKNFDPDNEKNSLNLFEGLGFSRDEILAFRNELLFSAAPSIDTFLEPRQEEERYLGKLAIAYALIPFEQTAPLFYDGSWYSTLLNKIQPNFDDFEKNQISFITFNYDRSLEHFLMTALKNRFKKTETEVAEKLKKIPIVHLYGKLANLTWENNGVDNFKRDYNPEITPHLLRKSSKSLKIIYDKVEITDPDFKQARDLIKAASRIYFLGFGFHKDNLERLRIKSILEGRLESPIVEATSYRLPQDLKESIPKLYKIKFPNHDWDINEMFEQKIRL